MSTHSIFQFALFSLLFFTFLSHFNSCVAQEVGFSYDEGTNRGPSRWGTLNTSWYLCGNGTSQSPIDISRPIELRPQLGALQTQYKPAQATLLGSGYDVAVEWNADAGDININGVDYKLLQTHWHTPSEHTINGQRFDMELHIVHKNSLGEIAVVGILYRFGLPDPFLSKLYYQIRSLQNNGSREIDLGIVDPNKIGFINRSSYYRYNGSLTTPPCDEGVLWTLLQQVKTVSMKQVQALKDAVDEENEENARPIQPRNGRKVYKYVQSRF